jgi:hypothetical protein
MVLTQTIVQRDEKWTTSLKKRSGNTKAASLIMINELF